jgi:hypothetical protein
MLAAEKLWDWRNLKSRWGERPREPDVALPKRLAGTLAPSNSAIAENRSGHSALIG